MKAVLRKERFEPGIVSPAGAAYDKDVLPMAREDVAEAAPRTCSKDDAPCCGELKNPAATLARQPHHQPASAG
jgi:hypothetical protein